MTTQGVDYAWSRPDPALLARAGKRFACRYLSYNTTGKNLTVPERDRLLDAGVLPVLNWEHTTTGAMGGYAAGRKHATDAEHQAHALGAPADVVIYFSVDFDAQPGDMSTLAAYFDGVCSVIPFSRVGVYGGYEVVKRGRADGWASFLWQTYAWSDGRWHPAAHIRQYRNHVSVAGGTLDLDSAEADYIGQWDRQGAVHDWEGSDMTPEQARNAWVAQCRIKGILDGDDPVEIVANRSENVPTGWTEPNMLQRVIKAQQPPDGSGLTPADVTAVAAAVKAMLTTELGQTFIALDAGKEADTDDPANVGR